jgi:hypothetical protein
VNSTKYSISLYGKTTGRATQENKYELPPPLDNTLFFGSIILINKDENGEYKSISEKEWDAVYEALYGGFEDIGDEDSEEEEDAEDEYDDLEKTKSGYAKDGFIVDDDSEMDEDDEFNESDSEECYKPKKKAPKKKKTDKKSNEKTLKIDTSEQYLDCTSELEMEEYLDEN